MPILRLTIFSFGVVDYFELFIIRSGNWHPTNRVSQKKVTLGLQETIASLDTNRVQRFQKVTFFGTSCICLYLKGWKRFKQTQPMSLYMQPKRATFRKRDLRKTLLNCLNDITLIYFFLYHILISEAPSLKNIAKGTTDPRVEFISQDHSSQFTNLDYNFRIWIKH